MVTEDDIIKLHKKWVGNKKLNRSRAVKLYCKELCCAGDNISWKKCTFFDCFLWNFRMGRQITEKERLDDKGAFLLTNSTKNKKLGGIHDH